MNATTARRCALLVCLTVMFSGYAWRCAASVGSGAPVPAMVVGIDMIEGRITYTIDERKVTGVIGLSRLLQENFRGRGDPRTVVGVFGAQVPIEQLTVLRGVAMKIGYERVRFFRREPDTDRIFELIPGQPYYVREQGAETELVGAITKEFVSSRLYCSVPGVRSLKK